MPFDPRNRRRGRNPRRRVYEHRRSRTAYAALRIDRTVRRCSGLLRRYLRSGASRQSNSRRFLRSGPRRNGRNIRTGERRGRVRRETAVARRAAPSIRTGARGAGLPQLGEIELGGGDGLRVRSGHGRVIAESAAARKGGAVGGSGPRLLMRRRMGRRHAGRMPAVPGRAGARLGARKTRASTFTGLFARPSVAQTERAVEDGTAGGGVGVGGEIA